MNIEELTAISLPSSRGYRYLIPALPSKVYFWHKQVVNYPEGNKSRLLIPCPRSKLFTNQSRRGPAQPGNHKK
jgi:hypothetical protein